MVSDLTAGCVQCWCFVTYVLEGYTVLVGTVKEVANITLISHMKCRWCAEWMGAWCGKSVIGLQGQNVVALLVQYQSCQLAGGVQFHCNVWRLQGTELAIGDDGGTLSFHSISDKKQLNTLVAHEQRIKCVSSVSIEQDNFVVSASSSGHIKLWNYKVICLDYCWKAHQQTFVVLVKNICCK